MKSASRDKQKWARSLSSLILAILFSLTGCIAQNNVKVTLKNPAISLKGLTVANVQVINNQIIITGTNLNGVSNFKIKNGSTTTALQIESKTSTSIIANTLSNMTFAAGSVFDFILSNANAASTFTVNFTPAGNSITAPMLTSMGATKGQVMKYNGASWVPSSVTNAQIYLGTWNATLNSPDLTLPSSIPGDYYIVAVAGTFNAIVYAIGDWIISDGYNWQKVGNSAVVVSTFNGRRGIVTLQPSDYGSLKSSGKITGSSINDLADINLTTIAPLNGDFLQYDSGTGKWIPGVAVTSGGTVTSVSGTAPITVATGTSTPAISIAQSNTTTSGFLSSTDWNTFSGKAPLASPTFTGVPVAPTAAVNTNTTQIATTAFVMGQTALSSPTAGSSSITTVGTVTTGTWNASTLAILYGGTGATTASGARASLGLGTAAQATIGALSTNVPILGTGGIVGANLCAGDNAGGIICNTMTSSVVGGSVSDETGLGVLVFGTSPTISNPVITNIAPAADFTLTQNAVVPFTSVNTGAVANTLYLKAGSVGIGTTTPTALLQLKAGTAAVNTAPLKLTSGTNLTTPEAGAIEFDGTSLYYTTNAGSRQTLGISGAGLTNLNGLTGSSQTFGIGATGTAPAFSSATSTHTLNIPMAATALVTAGLLSNADYAIFNGKAPLASPTFTGVPVAPTAAVNTNTTQIATTAFVVGQAASVAPLINGTAAVGTSLLYTRQDHIHPTDTTRAPTAGSSSITTLGTVTAGVWNGTTIAVANGGTGLTSGTLGGIPWYVGTGTLASSSQLLLNGIVLGGGTTAPSTMIGLGTGGQVLTSNGVGGPPTWQTSAGGALSAITAAVATNTIDNTLFAQIWNWATATTQNLLTMAANALTSGSILNITTSSNSVNSLNGLLNVANTGTSTSGVLARFQANSVAGSGMTLLTNGNVGIGNAAAPSAKLDVQGTLNASGAITTGSMAYATLTDGVTVTWTVAGIINNAVVTLAANRTLAFSGLTNGMSGTLIIKQDATGNRTLTLPSACINKVNNSGSGVVTLSVAANSIDILAFTYDGTNCYWTYGKNYN